MWVVISNTNTLPEQLLAVVEKEMVRGQRLCLPPALLSGLKTNSIRGCGCTAVEKQQLEVTAY